MASPMDSKNLQTPVQFGIPQSLSPADTSDGVTTQSLTSAEEVMGQLVQSHRANDVPPEVVAAKKETSGCLNGLMKFLSYLFCCLFSRKNTKNDSQEIDPFLKTQQLQKDSPIVQQSQVGSPPPRAFGKLVQPQGGTPVAAPPAQAQVSVEDLQQVQASLDKIKKSEEESKSKSEEKPSSQSHSNPSQANQTVTHQPNSKVVSQSDNIGIATERKSVEKRSPGYTKRVLPKVIRNQGTETINPATINDKKSLFRFLEELENKGLDVEKYTTAIKQSFNSSPVSPSESKEVLTPASIKIEVYNKFAGRIESSLQLCEELKMNGKTDEAKKLLDYIKDEVKNQTGHVGKTFFTTYDRMLTVLKENSNDELPENRLLQDVYVELDIKLNTNYRDQKIVAEVKKEESSLRQVESKFLDTLKKLERFTI